MYPRPFTEKQMRASIQGGGADNMETRVSRGISYRLFRKTIEEVLESVDLDDLMKNPQLYLEELSKQYYESHMQILEKAIEIGENQANRILKEIGKS